MLRHILETLKNTKNSKAILENKEVTKTLTPEQLQALQTAVGKTELLPYLELAYTFEHNGDAKEHAEKLGTLFANTTKALEYLIAFSNKYPKNEQFVHDACLFSVPTHSSTWKKLATQNGAKLLLDPELKQTLFITNEIEAQLKLDQKDATNLIEALTIKYENKDLTELETLIMSRIAELNKFCKRYETQADKRKAGDTAKHKKALEDRNELYADRACLHLKVSFKQWTHNHLRDYYVRYRLLLGNDTKAFFFKHGLSESNYKTFIALDRSVAGQNIPDIKVLRVNDQFYLRKLKVQNEADAALAAVIGKLTDCCQSLSGETGEPCVIHGLTSADSGFYVLFEGDAENPSPTDQVWGQTWVCRTESGSLLFDSIESKQGKARSKDAEIVITAFRQLATVLTKNYGVSHVQCGARSGVSNKVGTRSFYRFTAEPPKNYYHSDYRDSEEQLLVSDQRLLFSFIAKESNKIAIDQTALNQELEILSKTDAPSEKLLFNIGFIIQNNKSWLVPLLTAIPFQPAKEQIEHYINLQKLYLSLQSLYSSSNAKEVEEELFSLIKSDPVDCDIWENEPLLLLVIERNNIGKLRLLLEHKAMVNVQNRQGMTGLMLAAEKGSREVVSLLLDEKADVNIQNTYKENTALHLATIGGHSDVVRQLIAAKANVSMENSKDMTPLMLAVEKGHHDIFSFILEAKPELNTQDSHDENTALHFAIINNHEEMTKNLIIAKADVNLQNKKGITPLMLAVEKGQEVVFGWLLNAKAEVNTRNKSDEDTALHLASEAGHADMVKLLIEAKANVNMQNKEGITPLMFAAEKGHQAIFSLLLDGKAEVNIQNNTNKSSALHFASEGGYADMVKQLIEAKANKNMQDKKGITPLMFAAENSHQAVFSLLLDSKADVCIKAENHETALTLLAYGKGDVTMAHQLIEAKADVNSQTIFRRTALLYAAGKGYEELIQRLIAEKAHVNIPNREVNDDTVLINAAYSGNDKLIRQLLEEKAAVNVQGFGQTTALIKAAEYGHVKITQQLLEAKADVHFRDDYGNTALMRVAEKGHEEILSQLLDAKAELDIQEKYRNNTALHLAAAEGHTGVVKRLVAAKANVNKQNVDGRGEVRMTPLMLAAENGSIEMIKALLAEKADVNLMSRYQENPLDIAAQKNYTEIVTLLIEEKANVNMSAFQGTPLESAAKNGNKEIVSQLLAAKADPNSLSDGVSVALKSAAACGFSDIVSLLLLAKANLDTQVEQFSTALICAVASGKTNIVLQLLDAKANINISANHGYTALMKATEMANAEMVKLLIERKANLDMQKDFEETALMLAAEKGSSKIVKLLIEAKAQLDMQNILQQTALEIATKNNHPYCIGLLEIAAKDKQRPVTHFSVVTPISFFAEKEKETSGLTSVQSIGQRLQ